MVDIDLGAIRARAEDVAKGGRPAYSRADGKWIFYDPKVPVDDVLALLAEVERLRLGISGRAAMQRGTLNLLDNWTERAERAEAEVERLRAATAEHVAALDDAEGQVERLHREVIDLRTARNKDRETVARWARAVDAVRAVLDGVELEPGTHRLTVVRRVRAALGERLGEDDR